MQFNAWCQNCAVKVLYTNKVSLGAETFLFVVSEVQPDTMMKRENAFQKSLTPCLTVKRCTGNPRLWSSMILLMSLDVFFTDQAQ